MFDFLKKQDDSPPDIGKEEDADAAASIETGFDVSAVPKVSENSAKNLNRKRNNKTPVSNYGETPAPVEYTASPISSSFPNSQGNFELEKINARLEVINSFIKTFNERFSLVNQQIGEIRAMSVSNEKNLSLSNLDAKKVVDIVKEVNPEKLRVDYQKLDFRFNTLSEKIDANKQFVDSVVEEFKELKRKANLFEGTDALLKLNQDVKKDLIEIQKTNSRVRMNADKSEQIFIELNKGFQENQKINEIITTLDNSNSILRKEFEKISMDHKQVVNLDDFNDFKKKVESKFIIFESAMSDVEKIKEENEKLSGIIERILSMEKRNEQDIVNLSLARGANNVTSTADYEQKLLSILEIVDKMSIEIDNLKQRTVANPSARTIIQKSKTEKNSVSMPAINFSEETKPVAEEQIETIRKEVSGSKKRITDLLFEGRTLLQQGNSSEAIKIYEDISQIYDSADDDNNLTYSKIIKFYDDILATSNKPAVIPPVRMGRNLVQHHPKHILKKKHKPEKKYSVAHKSEVKYSLTTPARKFKKLSDY